HRRWALAWWFSGAPVDRNDDSDGGGLPRVVRRLVVSLHRLCDAGPLRTACPMLRAATCRRGRAPPLGPAASTSAAGDPAGRRGRRRRVLPGLLVVVRRAQGCSGTRLAGLLLQCW